ncbi:MAG: polyprenyl synthetase family protein, partial [Candidatus Hermodarchaeota archaeon]
DNFRRGNPAFHYRFQNYHKKYSLQKMDAIDYGNSIGIIGGDTTFFLGLEPYFYNEFKKEQNLKAISLYEQAFIEIANGVLIEMDMVNREDISISDYINMISLKTSALIEKSLLIGANYADVNETNIKLLSNYGTNLGIVFQITDDILGSFGDEKVTGKPTDGDIREGKKTCLLIEAYEKLNDKKKEQLNKLIQNQNMTKNDVQKVKDLFLEANAVDSCKELSRNYFDKAKNALDDLKKVIETSEAEFFESLLNFVLNRNY